MGTPWGRVLVAKNTARTLAGDIAPVYDHAVYETTRCMALCNPYHYIDNKMEQKCPVLAGIQDAGGLSSISGGPVLSMLSQGRHNVEGNKRSYCFNINS